MAFGRMAPGDGQVVGEVPLEPVLEQLGLLVRGGAADGDVGGELAEGVGEVGELEVALGDRGRRWLDGLLEDGRFEQRYPRDHAVGRAGLDLVAAGHQARGLVVVPDAVGDVDALGGVGGRKPDGVEGLDGELLVERHGQLLGEAAVELAVGLAVAPLGGPEAPVELVERRQPPVALAIGEDREGLEVAAVDERPWMSTSGLTVWRVPEPTGVVPRIAFSPAPGSAGPTTNASATTARPMIAAVRVTEPTVPRRIPTSQPPPSWAIVRCSAKASKAAPSHGRCSASGSCRCPGPRRRRRGCPTAGSPRWTRGHGPRSCRRGTRRPARRWGRRVPGVGRYRRLCRGRTATRRARCRSTWRPRCPSSAGRRSWWGR